MIPPRCLPAWTLSGPMRKWCFINGQEPVEAELLSIRKGVVTLKASGDRIREFPLDKFSPEDEEVIRRIRETRDKLQQPEAGA